MTKLHNSAFTGIVRRSFFQAKEGNKRRIPGIRCERIPPWRKKNFTFPQTCRQAGRYSEMTGCGSYFASRKSEYKNFTFPKYSEMIGCSSYFALRKSEYKTFTFEKSTEKLGGGPSRTQNPEGMTLL
jgi:hypothetical protein